MLIRGNPQFETQDDFGIGDGIPPIPEWQLDSTVLHGNRSPINSIHVDSAVRNVFFRLRNVFQRAQRISLPATRLHDLTCFVVHRLLLSALDMANSQAPPSSECIRYAIILYMFTIQGPTYYSHVVILNTMVIRFMEQLKQLDSEPYVYDSLDVWFVAIGMVASIGTIHYPFFMERAQLIAASLQLKDWSQTLTRIESILWLKTLQGESIFRPHWDVILGTTK